MSRASGRTTRLVDSYVQILFNDPDKSVFIKDHNESFQSNISLVERINQRLKVEHKVSLENIGGGYYKLMLYDKHI